MHVLKQHVFILHLKSKFGLTTTLQTQRSSYGLANSHGVAAQLNLFFLFLI